MPITEVAALMGWVSSPHGHGGSGRGGRSGAGAALCDCAALLRTIARILVRQPRLWTNPIMRNKDGVCRGAFAPGQATFVQ